MQQTHLHSWILHKIQWGRCTTKGTALRHMKPSMTAQTPLHGWYKGFQTSIYDVIYVEPSFQNLLICKSNTVSCHHPNHLHLDRTHHLCCLLSTKEKVPYVIFSKCLFAQLIFYILNKLYTSNLAKVIHGIADDSRTSHIMSLFISSVSSKCIFMV